ncbi:MAG: GNAT family N-acetyltransferase [Epulopiscium sp. Nele67-Bin005]|nr:MAG: GNAT family N-acetyltransferase [Epulopiscium sp. Nele67-Bin005]
MNIRNENLTDANEVETLIREAFWNLYVMGCDEHLSAHQIRKHPDFIPQLTFVLEDNNQIIGSITCTNAKIIDKNNAEHPVISFGPVCIHPDFHRQGLGRKLITHFIKEAKKLDYSAIITLGFEHHYSPYGFKGGQEFNISYNNSFTGLLVLPLFDGALEGISGNVHFTEALEVTPTDLEKFDALFPYKKKVITQSQLDFQKFLSENL